MLLRLFAPLLLLCSSTPALAEEDDDEYEDASEDYGVSRPMIVDFEEYPWVCISRNLLGRAFPGTGWSRIAAHAESLKNCQQASFGICHVWRCERD